MNIGIVGLGVVGKAHKFGFEKLGHSVSIHDIAFKTSIQDVVNTEVVYICVPTPSDEDGSCNISIVESVVSELLEIGYEGVISIKSTITPGTTEKMCKSFNTNMICFCPEFLRERSAEVDLIENNNLLAVGTHDTKVYDIVKKSHGDYPKNFVMMTPTECEILKYYSNVYNALRVTFANSMYEICESLDADYDKIQKSFVKRNTSSGKYLIVNDNWRGYGGVCLPKDTKALVAFTKSMGLDLKIFETIDKENDKFLITVPKGMRNE